MFFTCQLLLNITLGEYSRNNDALYGIEAEETLDHDFKTKETKTRIPHGIYDIAQNTGYK